MERRDITRVSVERRDIPKVCSCKNARVEYLVESINELSVIALAIG